MEQIMAYKFNKLRLVRGTKVGLLGGTHQSFYVEYMHTFRWNTCKHLGGIRENY